MASVPYEFIQDLPDDEPQPSPSRRGSPPGKSIGTDLLDPEETVPPRGLVPHRWLISLWLGIALLLGAIVTYSLLGYAVD